MSYPRNILVAGERIVVHRHPHWRCLIAPVAGLLVVSALAGVAAGLAGSAGLSPSSSTATSVVVVVVWAAIVAWLVVRPVLRWRTTHFVLTDRRFAFRRGVLTRSGVDIPLHRIHAVRFHHGLLDRMMRTGTLTVESASDDPLTFTDVPQVQRLHAMLHREAVDNPPVWAASPRPFR